MTEASTQPKPGTRRRQGRGNSRAQKAYASENDLITDPAPSANHYNHNNNHHIHGHMQPQTPQKNAIHSGSPAANSSRVATTRQRTKHKSTNHQNAASTSPEPDHALRATPQRPASVKGPSHMAFAGATFHASPAPSALPMPSFFSKPAGGSPNLQEAHDVVQEPSPPATIAHNPTPQRQSAHSQSNESPLDFMFRAHRQEQRQQSHGSFPTVDLTTTPSKPAFNHPHFTKASTVPHARPVFNRHVSNSAIDDGELGGGYHQHPGPSFATPYHERIHAARPAQNHPSPNYGNSTQQWGGNQQEDPTEALKKFLFNGNKQSPASSASAPQRLDTTEVNPSPSAARTYEPMKAPHQEQNIQAMENDLRRILKLDSVSTGQNTERRLFTQ